MRFTCEMCGRVFHGALDHPRLCFSTRGYGDMPAYAPTVEPHEGAVIGANPSEDPINDCARVSFTINAVMRTRQRGGKGSASTQAEAIYICESSEEKLLGKYKIVSPPRNITFRSPPFLLFIIVLFI